MESEFLDGMSDSESEEENTAENMRNGSAVERPKADPATKQKRHKAKEGSPARKSRNSKAILS